MFRSICIIIVSAILTIIGSLMAIVSGMFNPYSKFTNGIIRIWAKSILWVSGIEVIIEGLNKLQPGQSYVFIANHQSTLDIMVYAASIPGTARFIAKKELFKIPIFAQGMKLAGIIAIDRGNSAKAKQTIDKAVQTVKNGVSVIIFPEGTRSKDGTIQRFKKGAFILALNGGIPITPTVISGSGNIMEKKSMKLKHGRIKVQFLDPISTENLKYESRNQLVEKVRNQIIENFDPDYNKD